MMGTTPHFITKNFTREEFACPCCGRSAIDELLVRRLQDLRDLLGTPIHINSGFRCVEHNRMVGGAEHSLHLAGMAADLSFFHVPLWVAYEAVKQVVPWGTPACGCGGLGLYPDRWFIHLDVAKVTRWGKLRGKYVPLLTAEQYLSKLKQEAESHE